MSLKSYIAKSIAILGIAGMGLNAGISYGVRRNVNTKLGRIESRVMQLHNYHAGNQKIEEALVAISDLRNEQPSLLAPFWRHQSLYDKANQLAIDVTDVLSTDMRVVNVGLAYEGKDPAQFMEAANRANITLMRYGLSVNVNECEEVRMPDSLSIYDLRDGIHHSFDKPQDYCFAWTSSDLSRGEDDFAVQACTNERVCLIDNDMNHERLEGIIAQEVLRLFSDAKDTTTKQDDPQYLAPCDTTDVLLNKDKRFAGPEYDLAENMETQRTVTVNVRLDGVPYERARKILESVSAEYEKRFNIRFLAVDFYEWRLPQSWNAFEEMSDFERKARRKSDVHMIMTGTNWKAEDDTPRLSVAGQSLPYYGYCWMECVSNDDEVVQMLCHEFGHLFQADHVYRKNCLMNPIASPDAALWTPYTVSTILANKFMSWKSGLGPAEGDG